MSMWSKLLEVQECDTKIKQLDFKVENLPERSERHAAVTERFAIESRVAEHRSGLDELLAQQINLEDQVATSAARRETLDASLYDGTVVAHKDLEALQTEIAAHKETESGLEEQILELMEQIEPIEETISQHLGEIARVDEQLSEIDARLTVAEAEVLAEKDGIVTERDAARSEVPAELLSAYDQLAQHVTPAVARLEGRKCRGCHIDIPSAQVEDILRQPEDAIVSCPECMCMLVRS